MEKWFSSGWMAKKGRIKDPYRIDVNLKNLLAIVENGGYAARVEGSPPGNLSGGHGGTKLLLFHWRWKRPQHLGAGKSL
jgi:hypothetical protein